MCESNGSGEQQGCNFPERKPNVPIWRQRPYQLTLLGILCVCGIVAGISFVVMNYVGGSSGSASASSVEAFRVPSEAPSDLRPSAPPSDNPSALPSLIPSNAPTKAPTDSPIPTIATSLRPTRSPAPTFGPTMSPTDDPTISAAPSTKPSQIHSESPSTAAPSSSGSPSQSIRFELFGFYLMGDVPYAAWEEQMLVDQMANMTLYRRPDTYFTVHVGDIQKPARTQCRESVYQTVAYYLLGGPLPTFILPGDNDWNDCPDPEEAIGFFRYYFKDFEDQWKTLPDGVPRMNVTHHPYYPEMFRFEYNQILFLSVDLTDSKPDSSAGQALWDEWNNITAANINWVWTHFEEVVSYIRAVIIFGQALYNPDSTKEFFQGVAPMFVTQPVDVPVMYLHGDGHKWGIDDRASTQLNWPSLIDVQVDQGGFADPCIVEIAAVDGAGQLIPLVAEHDLQYVFADGLVRIDRQRGRYNISTTDNSNSS